jgi:hypothetical protein
MQYGRCIEATPKSILSENEFSLKATCENLSHLFEDALEVELFSIPGAASTIEDIKVAYPQIAAKSGLAEAIARTADALGIPDPGWLANLMNFETDGDFSSSTTNQNVPACKGLIQFCPAKLKMKTSIDVYMAVFQPAAIGRPDMKFDEKITKGNPGVLSPRHYASKANKGAKLPTELVSGIS